MMTRILLATLVGGVVMFLLGYLIFGVLLEAFIKANTTPEAVKLIKEPPNLILLFLSNLIFAWILAFVFERWASIKTFVSGMFGGAMIASSIALAVDLQLFATMNLMSSAVPVLVDFLAVGLLGAVSGGVIGLMLGKLNKMENPY
jgi:hypothetical protein